MTDSPILSMLRVEEREHGRARILIGEQDIEGDRLELAAKIDALAKSLCGGATPAQSVLVAQIDLATHHAAEALVFVVRKDQGSTVTGISRAAKAIGADVDMGFWPGSDLNFYGARCHVTHALSELRCAFGHASDGKLGYARKGVERAVRNLRLAQTMVVGTEPAVKP